MKTPLIILFFVLSLFSCKSSKEEVVKIESIGGIEQPVERNYITSELTIGRRICSALKNKRELFEKVINMQEKFRFRGETKACGHPTPFNISEFTVAISNVSSTDFEYIAIKERPNYFKDVVTDQNGAMRILCDNLTKSDTVSNTWQSGSSYITVNLLINEGYDTFNILKKSLDSTGNYQLVSSESISVVTLNSQANEKFFGVEKTRVRNSSCPNSKDFSSLKQSWVSALTSF